MKSIIKISFLFTFSFLLLPAMEEQPTKISWREFQKAICRDKLNTVNEYLEKEKPDPKKLIRPLHSALNSNARGSVALLLRYGTPVNEPYCKNGPTPLLKMTKTGNVQMVEWLRIFAANPYIENKQKLNSLEIAYQKFQEAKEKNDEEERKKYFEIFFLLRAPYALLQMRQYQVQAPIT